MRRTIRSIGVLFVAMLGAIGLVIGSAFSAALAYGAIALIVPGTGTPNANIVDGYLTQARDRYLTTTACGADGSGCPVGNQLQGINYPATFFPLFIFNNWCTLSRCNTWDDSVGQGTAALNASIQAALDDPSTLDQQIVVFGYSQGGAVVADSLNGYINGLSAADKARIQIVTIGGIENPDGGLWQRLNFLPFLSYIPFLNVSLNPPMNPDTGVNYTSIGFQYDPVVNAPKYFGNAFALINALAAFENVHGYYLSPNGNGESDTLPYGYNDTTLAAAMNCTTSPANCKKDEYGNTYITIPAPTLPIYNLLLGVTPSALLPIVQPLVNLLTPVTRLLIDLGYDNTGDPSVPTPLSLLPVNPATFNPITFAGQFVQAIVQGIQDAINGGPAPTVVPATTTPVASTLALRSIAPQADVADAADVTGATATVTDLVTKKDVTVPAATDVKDPVTTDATPVTVSDPAATTPAVTESAPSATTPPATDAAATTPAVKTADPAPATSAASTTDASKTDDSTKTGDSTKTDDSTKSGDVTKSGDSAKTGDATKDDPKKDASKSGDVKSGSTTAGGDVKKADVKKDDVKAGADKTDGAKKDEPKKDSAKKDSSDGGSDSASKSAA